MTATPDYGLTSAHDQKLAADASPELQALAEVLRIAVPGLKMPHATMAATMARMLRARGVQLVAVSAASLTIPPASAMSDRQLQEDFTRHCLLWDKAVADKDGHSGSPGEWIVECMDELRTEAKRRGITLTEPPTTKIEEAESR